MTLTANTSLSKSPTKYYEVASKSPTPPPSQSLRPSPPRLSQSNQVVREKYTGTPPPTNGLVSLDGSGRLTVYQAPASSRTFYFTAGDVGYVPMPNAHYLENTDNVPPVFLE